MMYKRIPQEQQDGKAGEDWVPGMGQLLSQPWAAHTGPLGERETPISFKPLQFWTLVTTARPTN